MIIADLHIHSKYSRATSKNCEPEYLDLWVRRKGIGLLGTGDFTHPAWREELKEKLVPAEEGLYTLQKPLQIKDSITSDAFESRFVVSGEISSIYKKNGKVRKVHNLILLPSLEAAEILSHKLEAIGNIHSDGRPILGLDSKDLLEITLESCPDAIFIPAHIWTPHFSLFGAFSGFDTIEECFEDLTPYIHALETGLSSDPPMNWRISALDKYTLVSNSDAHSPAKLGREANLLDIDYSYTALAEALQPGSSHFAGTIEFFPEEGKYHYDGHRKCELCLKPAETEKLGGKCPLCGRKITIGVQHRIEQLADRPENYLRTDVPGFESLVPLPEVIAASIGVSAASAKVTAQYENMLQRLGPEFPILRQLPLEDIRAVAGPCVEEGIRRLRKGEVERIPGYDGEYGKIKLLDSSEISRLNGQVSLFGVETSSKPNTKKSAYKSFMLDKATTVPDKPEIEKEAFSSAGLNKEQKEAVCAKEAVVAVVAGPGTGKTKTLISRILYLIEECGVKPSNITAVTFTNKAAAEMRERLERALENKRTARSVNIGTFHSICLQLCMKENKSVMLIGESEALELAKATMEELSIKGSAKEFLRQVSKIKNGMEPTEATLSNEQYMCYCNKLQQAGMVDFDDLLLRVLSQWEKGNMGREKAKFSYLLVDEFQDINKIQYQLLQAWQQGSKNLFVIGDPDQSIYSFRGADGHCFETLYAGFPQTKKIYFKTNYRSSDAVLRCALPLISNNQGPERNLHAQKEGRAVRLVTAESDLSEAIFIAKEINRMVGGIDMLDAQNFDGANTNIPRDFSDIAVLYRTHRQAALLEKCLRQESIPYIITGRENFLEDEKICASLCFFSFLQHPQDVFSLCSCLKTIWDCPKDLLQQLAMLWQGQAITSIENAVRLVPEQYLQSGHIGLCFQLVEKYASKFLKEKPRKLLEQWGEDVALHGYENYEKLLNMAVFHKNMPAFLESLALGEEGDLMRSASGKTFSSGAVKLMTLHGSKGLEFPVVFLYGLKQGNIPLESEKHKADIEEERRLLYVGMTRAEEELLLLTSETPSPFVEEIPKEFLERVSAGKGRQKLSQLSLF